MSEIVTALRLGYKVSPDTAARAADEIDRLKSEVELLTAQVKTLRALLAEYEAEADAPVVCEGATE